MYWGAERDRGEDNARKLKLVCETNYYRGTSREVPPFVGPNPFAEPSRIRGPV